MVHLSANSLNKTTNSEFLHQATCKHIRLIYLVSVTGAKAEIG